MSDMASVPPTEFIPTSVATESAPIVSAPVDEAAHTPAKALEPITGEPDIFTTANHLATEARDMAKPYYDKVDQTARPIVEKVTQVTRPYTDAVAHKVSEMVGDLKEEFKTTGAPSISTDHDLKGAAEEVVPVAQTTADKAKGVFEQGLSAVTSTFNSVTQKIEDSTTTSGHKGIISQISEAVQKGVEKVDHLLDQPAGASASPAVQTTTNSVPHTETTGL